MKTENVIFEIEGKRYRLANESDDASKLSSITVKDAMFDVIEIEPLLESMILDIQSFANDVYKTALDNGRYESKPGFPPLMLHVISELTEASSAYLSDNKSKKEHVDFAYQNIDNPMYNDFFKNNLKSKLEDEMADAILVLLSVAGYLKIDIAKHLILKNEYNKHRNEHSVFNNYENQRR